jgi:hypothetical protein
MLVQPPGQYTSLRVPSVRGMLNSEGYAGLAHPKSLTLGVVQDLQLWVELAVDAVAALGCDGAPVGVCLILNSFTKLVYRRAPLD